LVHREGGVLVTSIGGDDIAGSYLRYKIGERGVGCKVADEFVVSL
jgi:hypothetical protein